MVKLKAIPGHSLTLWLFRPYSFFGIGVGSVSTLHPATVFFLLNREWMLATIFMTTNIAAAVSTVARMVFTWVKYGKPDVSVPH